MWTPPGEQARIQIRVGWQSGQVLSYVRPLMQPLLAAGPYGVREIGSKSGKRAPSPPPFTGFSDPVLSTVCPYPVSCVPVPDGFFAFRFSPLAAPSGGSTNPVGLPSRAQRPDPPCRPVGERHRDHLLRLACQHRGQPRIRDLAAPHRVLDDRHGSRDQEASQVSLSHLRYPAQESQQQSLPGRCKELNRRAGLGEPGDQGRSNPVGTGRVASRTLVEARSDTLSDN